jgi:hypothetical protein
LFAPPLHGIEGTALTSDWLSQLTCGRTVCSAF